MARSAFKKKPKSALQKHKERTRTDDSDEEEQLVKSSARKEAVRTKRQGQRPTLDDKVQQLAESNATSSQSKPTKLKSKLWKDLDSKRRQSGLREYATPREAGVDYLSQWEGKRR